LKILHIIPNLPIINETSAIGGAASSLWTLARYQSLSKDVAILGNLTVIGGASINTLNTRIRLLAIPMKATRRTVAFGCEFFFRILAHPSINRRDVDIIHFHSGFLDYLPIAVSISRLRRLPLVYSAYCPAINIPLGRLSGYLIRSGMHPPIKIIPISKNVSSFVKSIGVAEELIHIVPPALDVDGLNKKSSSMHDARKKFGLPMDKLIVLFIGSYRSEKNLVRLIKSMRSVVAAIPNAHLIATTELKNKGDQRARLSVESVIASNNLNDHISIMGLVDEMALLVSSADVCVFPFIHTRGPSDYFIAALEAMALSKPVIVSPVGGMPEVVDSTVGILANPFSTSDLAHAIIKLLIDRDKRIRLGLTAKKRVREIFDARRIENIFNELYQDILE